MTERWLRLAAFIERRQVTVFLVLAVVVALCTIAGL